MSDDRNDGELTPSDSAGAVEKGSPARTRTATALVFAVVAVIGICAAVSHRYNIRVTEEARRADARAGRVHSVVQWEDRIFQSGDRIRIARRAGTFKPHETGFNGEIEAGLGHTGTVLAGERRVSNDHMTIDPAEPIQILRVRWDAQRWEVAGQPDSVQLREFDATIHVSYLETMQ